MRRRVPVLLCSFALATIGLAVGQPARAAVDVTAGLSTIGSATYAHGTSSCSGSTTTGMRITQLALHSDASSGQPLTITVTPTSAGFDPGFALYDGPFDPASAGTGCYDTTNVGGPGVAESVAYQSLVTGTTYTIVVFGTSGGGDYTLHVTGPTLDTFASTPDAPVLDVGTATSSAGQVTTHLSLAHLGAQGSAVTGFTSTLVDGTTHEQDQVTGSTLDSVDLGVTGAVGDDLSLAVTATNGVGVGPAATVQRLAAPVLVSLVPSADGASAMLTWTAPPGVTPYDAVYAFVRPRGTTSAPPAPTVLHTSPVALTGLVEGQTYDVQLVVTNPLDATPTAEHAVTMMSRPGAPTLVAGPATSASSAQVTIGAAATATGSNPVTSYALSASVPGLPTVTATSSHAGTVTLTGLNPSTTYTVTATATNTVGTGAGSGPVTVSTPPETVSTPILGVIPGPHTLTAYFAPTGGPVVLTAVPVAGGPSLSATGTRSPLKVSGLTDGVPYELFITNIGAIVPPGGGRVTHSGTAPKLALTLPKGKVAVGHKATIRGTFTAGGVVLQGSTVTLTRTVKKRTTTLGRKLSDRGGKVTFTVVATKGATYHLTTKLFDLKVTSRSGSIKLR